MYNNSFLKRKISCPNYISLTIVGVSFVTSVEVHNYNKGILLMIVINFAVLCSNKLKFNIGMIYRVVYPTL